MTNKLIWKQSVKYISIILVFLVGIIVYRLMWAIPQGAFYWFAGVVVLALTLLIIFDAMSVKDVIPIFKK